VTASAAARRALLPTYPFERQSFWIPAASRRAARHSAHIWNADARTGARLSTAEPIFETHLTPDSLPYLRDHLVHGAVLVAGPALIEMVFGVARKALPEQRCSIEGFTIHEPLVLPEDGRVIQTAFGRSVTGTTPFSIHS